MDAENTAPLKILVIEDSAQDAELLAHQLKRAGYEVAMTRVDNDFALAHALDTQEWDIVFSDFTMPDFNGMQALQLVREHDDDLPFIVVSGTISEEQAVSLMKLGAHDYVLKDKIQRLVPAVEREIKEAKLRREHRLAQQHNRHLVYFDPLTRLPNRHRLIEDLQHWLNRDNPVALMSVNLVDFRDTHGAHADGNDDRYICDAATQLQTLSDGDIHVYHLHGNEFALTLIADDNAKTEAIAQRALKVLSPRPAAAGSHVGARIGMVHCGGDDADPNMLLQRAYAAATLAKRDGKTIEWYTRETGPSSP